MKSDRRTARNDSTTLPAESRGRLSDETVDRITARVLMIGTVAAGAIVLAGGALLLARHGGQPIHYSHFHGVPRSLKDPVEIVRNAFLLHPGALIQLGLLILILTPVARVTFSVISFGVQRNWLYVGLAGLVLLLLVLGLAGVLA